MTAVGLGESEARALVAALVARSPYRKGLTPLIDDIVRIGLANRQVSAALAAVAARSRVATTGAVTKAELGAEGATLNTFLEHIYFASPGFLASVGEWPVGVMPDGR